MSLFPSLPELPDFDKMTEDFDDMRAELGAIRELLERLVFVAEGGE